eukprot:TRINITY_DN4235_c0_g1_i1.p1 TRINITY_DN4235_c0_g1~~TRINITY_DN4235_c0_g1_i1.p1  ORF type:complete len:169 (+),score=43.68 TRINITY_DN4235_c0_g1_i1:251-757(+)
MPTWNTNFECFYRQHDGREFSVNFADELQYKGQAKMRQQYGGDGTLAGSAKGFFNSLGANVAAKRLVKWDGSAHETVSQDGRGWESLSDKCAEGNYAVKMSGMSQVPQWIDPGQFKGPDNSQAQESSSADEKPKEEEEGEGEVVLNNVIYQKSVLTSRAGRTAAQVGF